MATSDFFFLKIWQILLFFFFKTPLYNSQGIYVFCRLIAKLSPKKIKHWLGVRSVGWAISDRLGLLNKILLAITDEKRGEKYGDIDSGNREVSWEGGGHFWWRRIVVEGLQEQFPEEAADLWCQQHEARWSTSYATSLCNSGGSTRRAASTLTRFISAAFLQVCLPSSVWVHGYDGRVKRRSDWRYPPSGTCSGFLFEGRLVMGLLPLLAAARKERSHFLLLDEDYWRIWKRSLLLLCWHLHVELNEM